MSLESVTAFQPFVSLPAPETRWPGRIASELSRRIASALGREPAPVVEAHLTGTSSAPDVAAAIRVLLGPDRALRLRPCDRLPRAGPVLVLLFRGTDASKAPEIGTARGNRVTPAGLARIVRACGAPVLPVLALPGAPRQAIVGAPIPAERLARVTGDEELLRLLHARVRLLRHRPVSNAPSQVDRAPAPALVGAAPVGGPVAPDLLEAEIAALPEDQRLVASGRFLVVQGRAHQLPVCVREVGRLRELTFRAVGEGTGRALDLDAYDRSYRHLLLFDQEERKIAGAYRFAPTDEILPVFGVDGLYTSSLFRMKPSLFEALGPALELGRSFVRAEYQRSYSPLLLLWRGLCAFISRTPRYRTLFGAVSVAGTYEPFSRELIATALSGAATLHALAGHVSPLHPLRPRAGVRAELRRLPSLLEDAAELDSVVSDVEADGKGLPVLLREYLKLGGRLLGFSVDPAFGYVLDGLIAVDLARTDRRLLAHYMGRDAARRFLAHHTQDETDDRAA
jgi:hypothetical protein